MSEAPDGVRRAAQQRAIEAAEREFKATGNPIFAWDAYMRARHDGLPIPEWFFTYLDDAARQLGVLVDRVRAGQVISELDVKIARAFRMKAKGAGTIFSRFVDRWFDFEWIAIGKEVSEHIRLGSRETYAVQQVADDLAKVEQAAQEAGYVIAANPAPSITTVWRAWKRYKRECL